MKSLVFAVVLILAGLLCAGCSQDADPTAPQPTTSYDKNGTETLGPPDVKIASGSGFVQGGVGMDQPAEGTLTVDVPGEVTISQVLLYWAGGTTGAPGDDAISIDGHEVSGSLIGGPTLFYTYLGVEWWFSSYRADITSLNLVEPGANSFTIGDFDFDHTGSTHSESNGASLLVIYDDGSQADISILDGLDMAFFRFESTLDSTTPQTFTFDASDMDRTAELVVFAGSVGEERSNQIKATTSAGEQVIENPLGSVDGPQWDSLVVELMVPAGDMSLTVELISTNLSDPLGASMAWVAAGLSVPVSDDPPVEEGCTRTIGYWKNHSGFCGRPDYVTPLLPVTLGSENGERSIQVDDSRTARLILSQRGLGHPRNGITKLYAQLLAAKLNVAAGASSEAIDETMAEADAFLADHGYRSWRTLNRQDRRMVLGWKDTLDAYNNGRIGPGHCDDGGCDGNDGRGGRGGRGGHGGHGGGSCK